MSEPKLQVCQIQIQPIDNGFVFQAVNVDGFRKSIKQAALDVPTLRQQLHKVIDELYEPPVTPPTPTPEPTPNGPVGTSSTAGT